MGPAGSHHVAGRSSSISEWPCSSVGLSDILPVTPMARALVMLESFAGIMYIALVVSRLINLAATARRTDRTPG